MRLSGVKLGTGSRLQRQGEACRKKRDEDEVRGPAIVTIDE